MAFEAYSNLSKGNQPWLHKALLAQKNLRYGKPGRTESGMRAQMTLQTPSFLSAP